MNRAVEMISKDSHVRSHEVAILGVTAEEGYLRLLAPDNFRGVGQTPLSSANSLAAHTVREKRPELINRFSVAPHASVFEAVPIADDVRSDPIQKIMSVPLILGSTVISVVQVSRKGKLLAETGPDFTYPQLRELKAISDPLAPCIILCKE